MDQTHMIHEQGDLGLFAEPIEQKENSDSENNENDNKSECK